jgi:hypothetical protein
MQRIPSLEFVDFKTDARFPPAFRSEVEGRGGQAREFVSVPSAEGRR